MVRRVTWTEAASRDLEQVVRYIARDSAQYAKSFAREVREASRSLSRFSERGRRVPELGEPDVREIFVRSYRLVYSLSGETLYILGLIHGARELGPIWEREER